MTNDAKKLIEAKQSKGSFVCTVTSCNDLVSSVCKSLCSLQRMAVSENSYILGTIAICSWPSGCKLEDSPHHHFKSYSESLFRI